MTSNGYTWWTPQEDQQLLQDVKVRGNRWSSIAALRHWRHRSPTMLRTRHYRLTAQAAQHGFARSAAPEMRGAGGRNIVTTQSQQPTDASLQEINRWAFEGAETSAQAEAVMSDRPGAGAGVLAVHRMGVLDVESHCKGITMGTAKDSCTQVIERAANGWAVLLESARREPTVGDAQLIRVWRLNTCANGERFLLCNFKSAMKKAVLRCRKEHSNMTKAQALQWVRLRQLNVEDRDRMGLVTYPGRGHGHRARQQLHTFLASGSSRTWVGGPQAGFYFSASMKAVMMGHRIRSPAWKAARQLLDEQALSDLVGDAIYMPFAEALRKFTDSKIAAARLRSPRTWGSLCCGGLDSLGEGTRRVRGELDVEFAAELLEDRRQIIRTAFSPRAVHSTAEAAALMAPPVTDLGASFPCRSCTQAKVIPAHERQQAQDDTSADTAEKMGILREYVARAPPESIIMEQAGGMVTHHHRAGEAHDIMTEALLQMPYAWWACMHDAAVTFRAGHHRKRLGLSAVRMDCLSEPVPRACVGAWWLEKGECMACGAGLIRGTCIISECDSNQAEDAGPAETAALISPPQPQASSGVHTPAGAPPTTPPPSPPSSPAEPRADYSPSPQ